MAISDSQKVDLLYKKLFGVAKSDTSTNKSPSNEATASPFINRGDKVWVQANSIPSTAASTAGIVQSYQTTSAVQTTADNTTTPVGGVYPTWKTSLTDWIPPEFGATYFISAYAGTTGLSDPTTGVGATKIFDSGSGGTGEWYFDYQAGVLNFIGTTIPAPLTSANTVYITGYRYIGQIGISTIAANTIYTQGVDATQNTRLTVIENTDLSQNVRLDWSNTSILSTDGKMQSAYLQANTGTVLAQASYNQANASFLAVNTAITIIQGTDVSQNSRITIIEATDVTQNTAIAATDGKMQSAYNKANTGGLFSGDVTITGNLVINGTTTSVNTSTITTSDSLIKLANNNTAGDSVDIGFYGTYNSSGQKYAGLVRQAGSNFFLFKDITTDPTSNTLPSGSLTGANTGILNANVIGYITSNGYSLYDYTTSLYNLANTQSNQIVVIQGVDVGQNSRMTIIEGVDTSQNTRLTVIEGTDVSQNTRIDYSNAAITIIQGTDISQNARMTIIEGTDVSQNVRLDYSNSSITIIQGVDLGQNTAIAATDGKMQSAYNQANTGTVLAQASYNQANVTIGVDATQNTRLTVIEGTDVSQNTNIAATDGKMQSAYNQANTGTVLAQTAYNQANVTIGVDTTQNTRLTIIEGTDVSQNTRIDYSNTAITIIQGVDVTQNTNIAATDGKMQSAYGQANTGTVLAQAGYNQSNASFLGVNTAITIIQGVDVTQNTRLTVIEGTDVAQNTAIAATDGKMQSAYNQANTGTVLAQAAYTQANVTIGVDTTQNTRLTVIEGTDASQNTRLDYSNSAITIIQGVDLGQNTSIASTDGKMQSAYNQANTGTVLAQAGYNQSNASFLGVNTAITIIQGTDVGQNSRMTIIEGTDVSQNIRMAIIEGVDATQNTRIDYSNTAITIIQGVDVTQNTNIASTDGKMQSAYNQANTGTVLAQASYAQANVTVGVDATQNTRLTVIENTDLSQNTRLDYSNSAITIIQGVDVSQNTRLTVIEGTDVSQNTAIAATDGKMQSAYNQANTGTVLAQASYNQANASFLGVNTAITIIQGTDVSQNNRMTIIEGVGVGQNTRMAIIEGTDITQNTRLTVIENTDVSQNTRIDYSNTAIVIIQGVDLGQNTAIAATDGKMQSSYNQANTGTVLAQASYNQANVTIGVDSTQNTRLTVIENTDLSQNTRLDYSNTAITIIQGVDVSQNTRMTIIEGVDATQNTNISNKVNLTGSLNQTISGNVTISQDLVIAGNLILTGNISSQNVQQLAVADPLIILGIGNYVSDTKDIGFAGHYNDGTNAHAGLIRDSGTKEFYIFQGYVPELDSNNNVIITDASFRTANLNANYVKGNLIATTSVVNGIDLSTYTQATYAQANVTIGVDTSQNARMTIIEGTNASQNTRLDYSNSAITIIQGVDLGQNTSIASTDGKMQSAYNQANTGTVLAQAGYNQSNASFLGVNTAITIIQGTDVSQNNRMTIIEGVDVTQNTAIAATDGKMQSAYNQANTGTVLAQASYNQANVTIGVDATQNTNIAATDGKMQNAFAKANTGTVLAQAAFDYANTIYTGAVIDSYARTTANNASSNTIIIQGVDNYQNNAIIALQSSLITINSNSSYSSAVDVSQNVRIDYSNTAITIIQGVDATQNTNISNKVNLTGSLNQTISGNVTIGQDLIISGNLVIAGNISSQNVQQLAVADPLILLGIGNYVSDTKDIGFASHYNDGVNAHAGLIRDSGTKEFYVFKGYIPEVDATNNIDINDASFSKANLNASYFKGNLIATTSVVNGIDLVTYSSAAFAQANLTIGVDATQNTRLTVIEGTDSSQNTRIDYSNTAITIIQGVDLGQNTAIAATDGKMQNAFAKANTGTVLAQAAFDAANTASGTIGYIAYNKANGAYDQANTATVLAQASYNQANVTIGVDATQNTNIALLQGYVNAANANIVSVQALANTDYTTLTLPTGTFGNSTFVPVVTVAANGRITNITTSVVSGSGGGSSNIDQWVRDTANVIIGTDVSQNARMTIIEGVNSSQNVRLDYSNSAITIIQGVDLGQNTAISATDGKMQSAYNQANTGTVLAQASYNQANVTIGVDTSQNARMTIIEATDVSQNTRIDYSNTAITIVQGVDVGQNTRMTIADGVDVSQNTRIDYSNTAINIIQGTDTSQNARMTIIEGTDVTQNTAIAATDGKMQSAYNKANTGGTFAGDVTITGNLVVNGVTTSVNTSTITTSDSLIKLANNNTAGDSVDIGFYGTYNSSGQKYAGLVRQAGSNFFLFKDITTDPTANTLPAGSLTGANTGTLSANVTGYITSNGYSLYDYTSTLYSLANTHSNQIVVIQGTDTSQNARMTIIEGTDVSQNTRIDYSNTAITIIQGVDTGQNANIALVQTLANTDFTNVTITTTTTSSNGLYVPVITVAANGRVTAISNTLITSSGGGSVSGYLANSVIIANTTGYLSNTANLSFYTANSTLVTSNYIANGNITIANTATKNSATMIYNSTLNSIDFYFN